jgi:hypothetical protein
MGSMGVSITSTSHRYPPGIHVPTLTWFRDDDAQSIDWEVQEKHIRFLIESGLHGSKRCLQITQRPFTLIADNATQLLLQGPMAKV